MSETRRGVKRSDGWNEAEWTENSHYEPSESACTGSLTGLAPASACPTTLSSRPSDLSYHQLAANRTALPGTVPDSWVVRSFTLALCLSACSSDHLPTENCQSGSLASPVNNCLALADEWWYETDRQTRTGGFYSVRLPAANYNYTQ